jgi:hypothetical protein
MKEKQAVTREYKTRYQAVTKKVKSALLDEFTRLTGCHRTCVARLLSNKPVKPDIFWKREQFYRAELLGERIFRINGRTGQRQCALLTYP